MIFDSCALHLQHYLQPEPPHQQEIYVVKVTYLRIFEGMIFLSNNSVRWDVSHLVINVKIVNQIPPYTSHCSLIRA